MAPDELEAEVDIRDGYVYPPEGPGLGLSINEDAINRTSIETLQL
jgi:L-alanine-DL-glutamate epimerase-like enolase superfamily enzyme